MRYYIKAGLEVRLESSDLVSWWERWEFPPLPPIIYGRLVRVA